jgi:predicted nuclease of restriction endonuclease-like (RecB) superfamily
MSGESHRDELPPGIRQTASGESQVMALAAHLPLPWSHYVKLLGLKNELARRFYETEALRGGWTVRQLARQIDSQFYERTLLSRDKRAMLLKGEAGRSEDELTPEEEIKDPFVLEFLGLKDEYSESDLEDALVRDLEAFLLELGGDFAFVGRQRRLRIGDHWFRIDLLFFHRRLRCLVVIDLKLGEFNHADAGQDAPVPQLRDSALDRSGRESAGRLDPVLLEGRGGGQVRPRESRQQDARSRVPYRPP